MFGGHAVAATIQYRQERAPSIMEISQLSNAVRCGSGVIKGGVRRTSKKLVLIAAMDEVVDRAVAEVFRDDIVAPVTRKCAAAHEQRAVGMTNSHECADLMVKPCFDSRSRSLVMPIPRRNRSCGCTRPKNKDNACKKRPARHLVSRWLCK